MGSLSNKNLLDKIIDVYFNWSGKYIFFIKIGENKGSHQRDIFFFV